ncbi:MAG: gamma-glutamyltransferase [Acidobacteriota bacterium]
MRTTTRLWLALAAAIVAATGAANAADRTSGRMFATRSVSWARHGMIAAAHPLAVQAGIEVLRAGGNAVDAAIATNAALAVVEPVSCGLGGDLFAIVWDPASQRLWGLNASGRAPLALTIDKVPPAADGTIPLYSPYAWTVPGAADGWFALHGKFGRLPMARVLAPAIRLARDGAPVPQVIAAAWARAARVFGDKPGFADVFLPDGRAPREGEVFRNPALARTLELLAKEGRRAFYDGEIAETIVRYSNEHGGFFAREDFARHRSTWVEPVSTSYRGVELWELPPNGQGIAALEMLNMLELFDLRALGRDSADFWHLLIEAKKLAFADRARWYADPEFADVPVAGLIDKDYARRRAAAIDMDRAARVDAPGDPALDRAETTYLAAGDGSGMLVSLIQSNYTGFGSGYVVPELGFGIQNRGALFNLDPEHPNALAPGKRPFHTIIPAFLTRGGRPWCAFGVMGGATQPQGHVQIVVNLVDFDMNIQEAGDAPRFVHTGSSQPTGTRMSAGGFVHLESGVPAEVRRALVRRGHRLLDAIGLYGGYQAVCRDPETGVLSGATESRKDGMAAGY